MIVKEKQALDISYIDVCQAPFLLLNKLPTNWSQLNIRNTVRLQIIIVYYD